jgi:hypothetical protein
MISGSFRAPSRISTSSKPGSASPRRVPTASPKVTDPGPPRRVITQVSCRDATFSLVLCPTSAPEQPFDQESFWSAHTVRNTLEAMMCASCSLARSCRPPSFKHLASLHSRAFLQSRHSLSQAMRILRSWGISGSTCPCMCLAGRHNCYDYVLCTSCPLCRRQLISQFVATVTFGTTARLKALRNRAKESRIDGRLNCRDLSTCG